MLALYVKNCFKQILIIMLTIVMTPKKYEDYFALHAIKA